MEKQDKTFGSIGLLDKLYFPTIENIIDFQIDIIENYEAEHGNRNGKVKVYFRRGHFLIASPFSTVANSDHYKNICVNKGKAIEIQQKLRRTKLNEIQDHAQSTLVELKKFTEKYF